MSLTRDHFVSQARLRYILGSLGAVHFGRTTAVAWSGDTLAGSFVEHDGCGNHVAVFWDQRGVVAIAFDHESPESEASLPRKARRPQRHFEGAPSELSELVARACHHGEGLVTDGAWALGKKPSSPFRSAEGAMFEGYDLTPKAAIARWRPESSLSAKQCALAVDLAKNSATGPYVMTEQDAAVALSSPSPRPEATKLEDLERAVGLLERVGITWPDAVEKARAEQAERERKQEAELGGAGPLLRAACDGDVEAAMIALAAGVNVDAAMPADFLPSMPVGVTPLNIALWKSHDELARRLIEAGADVNRVTRGSWGLQYPLRLAAGRGQLEICRLLLERGAALSPQEQPGGLFAQIVDRRGRGWGALGSAKEYAEVVRMLLDAKLPLPDEGTCCALANIVVEGGAPELEERLWAPPVVPVTLPELPDAPIVDATVARAKLPGLLQKAIVDLERGYTGGALDALEEAWRLTRHPRIADVVDIPLEPAVWQAPSERMRAAHAEQRFRAMAAGPPDPRWAREIVFWLHRRGAGTVEEMERAEDAAAAALVAVRDVRMSEPLALFCARESLGGSRVKPQRPSLLVALEALRAFEPVALTDEEERGLAALEDLLSGWKPAPGKPSIRALLRAVYDDPKNDGVRREIAARLEESGDPRGEFIRLQLQRAETQDPPSERERELLVEHRNRWLGRIAEQVQHERFERGFVWRATVGHPSLTLWDSYGWAVRPLGSGQEAEWATLERLSLWRLANDSTDRLLLSPRLQGLLEIADLPRFDIGVLAAGPTRPLEILELSWPRHKQFYHFPKYEQQLAGALARLPDLRELRFNARDMTLERIDALTSASKKLRRLSVGVANGARFPELVAFARQRGIDSIAALGPYDLTFELSTGTLELRFADVSFGEAAEKRVVEEIEQATAAVKPKRLVVRIGSEAQLEDEGGAPAPKLVRHGERFALAPLWEAAAAMGATCSIEPDELHWSGSPQRDR